MQGRGFKSMKRIAKVRPQETEIDRLARETRAKCNQLTDAQRKDLLNKAMEMIYASV